MRDSTLVSANETSVIAMAPAASAPRSASETTGIWKDGRPCGSGPTTETPAVTARSNTPTTIVAPTTAINTPGILGQRRLKIKTMARHEAPIAKAVQLVMPCATPCTRLIAS